MISHRYRTSAAARPLGRGQDPPARPPEVEAMPADQKTPTQESEAGDERLADAGRDHRALRALPRADLLLVRQRDDELQRQRGPPVAAVRRRLRRARRRDPAEPRGSSPCSPTRRACSSSSATTRAPASRAASTGATRSTPTVPTGQTAAARSRSGRGARRTPTSSRRRPAPRSSSATRSACVRGP